VICLRLPSAGQGSTRTPVTSYRAMAQR
jgi:hypothetical protein